MAPHTPLFAPKRYNDVRGPPAPAASLFIAVASGAGLMVAEVVVVAATGAALDGPGGPATPPLETAASSLPAVLAFGTMVGLLLWLAASAALAPLVWISEPDGSEAVVGTSLLLAWGLVPIALATVLAALSAVPTLVHQVLGTGPVDLLLSGPRILFLIGGLGWQTAIWAHALAAFTGRSPWLVVPPCGVVSVLLFAGFALAA